MFRTHFDHYIRRNFKVDYLIREDLVARLARIIRQINLDKLAEFKIDECMFMINYFMYLKMDLKVRDEVKEDIDTRLYDCFGLTFKEMTGCNL